ncbi:P-loop containing nucleoside triphosphate hydrolase protein [Pyronema omphalodes]|nr:P-loop containing nucleoside triphosphate hydrolase protein [Pyronema omphalodes]
MQLQKCNILMLGAKGVGKSCLSWRFATSLFSAHIDPTIDDVPTSTITFDNNSFTCHYLDVKDQQWELLESYVKGCDAVMLVYSIIERESLEEARKLGEAIRKLRSKLPMVVIGTMKELREQRIVKEDEGREVARGLKCGFWEVSAATGENCERVQEALCRAYLARVEEEKEKKETEGKDKDKGKDKGKGKHKRGCVIM